LNKYLASPLSVALSMASNAALHTLWPRRSGDEEGGEPPRRGGMGLVSLAAWSASYATFIVISWLLPDAAPWIAQLAAGVPAALIDYCGSAYWRTGTRPPAS